MSSTDKDAASRSLITFVRNYTDMLEKQLTACRQTLREAVDGIMNDINEISSRTAENKKKANTVLVKTYTEPDADARAEIDRVQDDVTRVFEEAQRGNFQPVVVAPTTTAATPATGGGNELRRTAGLFSKHMEALETLDGELSSHLISMMGMLSRDDVIAQRLDHVVAALQALQTSLSYILVDFDNRGRSGDIERFTKDLKSYVYRTFTMEEEKQVYYDAFPEERKAS